MTTPFVAGKVAIRSQGESPRQRGLTGLRLSSRPALVLAALCLGSPAAHAAEFYAGKTIEMIVGSDVGGGYDTYTRAIARHIGRHLPGHPSVVVKNMPGAGSGRAAAYLYSVAPKDGTSIAAPFPGIVLSPLLDDRVETTFDPAKFTYVGTADSGTRVCATFAASKTKTFDDALRQKTRMGASGLGASTRDYVLFKKKTADAQFDLVMGYKGSADILLAMERGEIDGICGWDWSSVKTQRPDWLRDGKLNLLVQVSLEPEAELTARGVPPLWRYIKREDDRKAVELIITQQMFQRPYVAPPGVPPEQANALRAAFDATMQDPQFRADAEKARIDINPLPGAKVQELVERIYATPKAVVERAKELLRP
jgi:tripartite-type tricarboxylate transporter receptor subunit TctC